MRRIIGLILLAVVCAAGLAGCTGSDTDTAGSSDAEKTADSAVEADMEESEEQTAYNEPEISIEDIDWSVEAAVLDGERFISLNYTNNTAYTIVGLQIEFVQKEDTTKQDLSVFKEIKNQYEYTDEEVSEFYLTGENTKMADPGETVSDSPLAINWTSIYIDSMDQYEVMEPDMATIVVIGDDEKLYTFYYDFKGEVLGSSSDDPDDAYEWSDSALADMLPKPDMRVVQVDYEDEDLYSIYVFGASQQDFETYVQTCKDSGFDQSDADSETYYSATNDAGYEVTMDYTSVSETYYVNIEPPEEE